MYFNVKESYCFSIKKYYTKINFSVGGYHLESYLRLSEVDKQILHSHALMLDGLGNFFGSTHEVILHSLENLESSAIKVINGHFSNRKEGAPLLIWR